MRMLNSKGMRQPRRALLLVQAAIEISEVLTASPNRREDSASAALRIRLCLLLALPHGMLLEPEQQRCTSQR